MSDTLSRDEWEDLGRKLREPFKPEDVDFRIDSNPNEQTGKARVVAYADARAVQDRLDAVVGPGGWAFTWEPITVKGEEVAVARGTLTIHGIAKSDAGSASNSEPSLGAVSHCFKRAAVHWGIGRYLYNVPAMWVTAEKAGRSWRLNEVTLRELRAKLPRPGQTAQAAQTQRTRVEVVADEQAQDAAATSQPGAATATAQPWAYLRDVAFRGRCKALGYLSVAQVEELVTWACGGAGQSVEKATVEARLATLEAKAKAAAASDGRQTSDLRQAFTGQART